MISQKPYLLRALYDWCNDNNLTPFITTKVDKNTIVPMEYVTNDQIVLNIHPKAINSFSITNDWLCFEASFEQVIHGIYIPVANIIAFFSKENGLGMGFNVEKYDPKTPKPSKSSSTGSLKLYK